MAVSTSRILLSLTIPSIFGLLSILWFLRRKKTGPKSTKKAIELEVTTLSSSPNRYHTYSSPMKLKEQEGSAGESAAQSDMQMRETQAESESQSENCNGVSSQILKIKSQSNGKLLENGSSCSEQAANGLAEDKASDDTTESANGVGKISLEDKIQIRDDCTVQRSKLEMETTNGGVSNDTDSLQVDGTPAAESLHEEEDALSSMPSEDTGSNGTQLEGLEPKAAKDRCDSDAPELPVEGNCLTVDSDCLTVESDCLTNDSSIDIQTDLHESFPDDGFLAAEHSENPVDLLESPGASKYCDSVGSIDSGKGASEIQFENHLYYMVYEFEIHPDDCGRLIGKFGRHVNFLKKQTNADLLIKPHPYLPERRLCSVTGTETEINAALKLIRKKFPIERYPSVTLAQINGLPVELQCPETLKLSLPEGVPFEAMLCATVSAGHFFLQQPTHPTFHSLLPLATAMTGLYSQVEAPTVPQLLKGNVVVASLQSGWFRAEVDDVFEEADDCRLKFLDYGGYAVLPRTSVRQIKVDYMMVPFQATECFLGSVSAIDDNGWSKEATSAFEDLAQGQILQGHVIGYAENRVPFVHLYKITGATSVFINQELVRAGLARWVSGPPQ